MGKIIIKIIPQTKEPPYLFSDYMITVDLYDKFLNMRPPEMDVETACNTAIMIAKALEFIGEYDVRFSTLGEDRVCTEYIAAYRRKENGTCYGNNKHQKG